MQDISVFPNSFKNRCLCVIHRDLYVHLWVDLSYKHILNKVRWNSRYTCFPDSLSGGGFLGCLGVFLVFVFLFLETLKENNSYAEWEDF